MSFFSHLSRTFADKQIQFVGTQSRKPLKVLLPEEKAMLIHANLRRQAEFATGRWCACRALAKLGMVRQPILCSGHGSPVWPPHVCGSLSHTLGACCAAVAFTLHYRSLGLDIESRLKTISPDAMRLIANDDEIDWLNDRSTDQAEWARIMFCAKESAFKMFSPLLQHRPLPFTVFSLLPPIKEGYFVVVLNEHLSEEFRQGQKYQGCYFKDQDWMLTLCSLKSEDK